MSNEVSGFTPAEVAQYFGVDQRTVRRWAVTGHIPGVGPFEATQEGGPGGRIHFQRQAMINLLEKALGRPWAAEDAEEAKAQRLDDKLSAEHNAKVVKEAKALVAANEKAHGAAYSADPQVRYA
jgi:hypothetical protein